MQGSDAPAPVRFQRPGAIDPSRRLDGLDALRGLAVLGVLIVNVIFMASPVLFTPAQELLAGGTGTVDEIASGLIGWLVTGKLIAMLATLFGAGLGLIAMRSLDQGRLRRSVFVRRSLFLIVLGLAHMILLFPGDILFAYGVTGLIAILFLRRSVRALLWWAGGIAAAGFVLLAWLSIWVSSGGTSAEDAALGSAYADAIRAYGSGDYLGIVASNTLTSAIAQPNFVILGQAWLLPLFLIGIAAAKSRVVTAPGEHRRLLRALAVVGCGVGLPVNLVLFPQGVLGANGLLPGDGGTWQAILQSAVTTFGVPLLSVGYAAALTLLWQRVAPPTPLISVGRMALTAYLLESLLALLILLGMGWYARVGYAASLALVVGIWILIIAFCTVWLRRFAYGPMEWAWRTCTYLRPPGRSSE